MTEVDELDGEIRRILAEVGDAAGIPPRFDELTETRRGVPEPPVRHRAVVWAAAATVAAGMTGLVVVLTARSSEAPEPAPLPQATSPAPDPSASRPANTTSASSMPGTATPTSPPSRPTAEPVSWFLPTALPDGYELTDISGRVDPGNAFGSIGRTWVRRGDDGRTIEARISAQTMRVDASAEDVETTGHTIHGLPAAVFMSQQGDGTVSWVENQVALTIYGTGLSEQQLVAVAEASRLEGNDVAVDEESLPEGFIAVTPQAGTTTRGTTEYTFFTVRPTAGGPGAMWAETMTYDGSLDEFVEDETERRDIDGVEYSILTREPDNYGPFNAVTSVHDGRLFTVTGRTSVDNVLQFAAGIRPATPAQAHATGTAITDRVRSLPEVARAVFADGTEVTARTLPGVDGAIAVCVEAPTARCIRPSTEATLGGGGESAIYELFESETGDRVIIGWQQAPPELTTSDGTPAELVDTAGGTFVKIPVRVESPPPTIELANNQPATSMTVTEVVRP